MCAEEGVHRNDDYMRRMLIDRPVQLAPGTYVEAVLDSSWCGWVIGQWNDNPYMVRVVWEKPLVRIDIGVYDDIRTAERVKPTRVSAGRNYVRTEE